MRILLLSDHATPHTIKWAKALSKEGLDICIFSLSRLNIDSYKDDPSIRIVQLGFDDDTFKSDSLWAKRRYLRAVPRLKKLIAEFRPDIVHAHYATSYGLLGVLSGFHPFIISVWGADVYDFPKSSFLHRMILRYNLKRADKILSTSHVMAEETMKYTDHAIEVTPFGIDPEVFKPLVVDRSFAENDLVIGTIKTLEEKYGISYLIRAFGLVKERHPGQSLKLLIVGGGTQEMKLKELAKELKIEQDVVFTGRVPFEEVIRYHNMLDIYVAVSTLDSESFGVAILEASACEKPVVVSNVGGLPEVVEDGVTGLIVDARNAEATAVAIEELVSNPEKREEMGKKGRQHVRSNFNWKDHVAQMIAIYRKMLGVP